MKIYEYFIDFFQTILYYPCFYSSLRDEYLCLSSKSSKFIIDTLPFLCFSFLRELEIKIGLGRMESTKQANPSPNSAVTFRRLNQFIKFLSLNNLNSLAGQLPLCQISLLSNQTLLHPVKFISAQSVDFWFWFWGNGINHTSKSGLKMFWGE